MIVMNYIFGALIGLVIMAAMAASKDYNPI